MRVRFWGTRGSIPTPGAKTLKYGGNTSCVEVRTGRGTLLIFDCGTGLRELGVQLMSSGQPVRGHIFLSHTHWDHIQGFPFFTPAFLPDNKFDIYAAREIDNKLADVLSGQMEYQYFPVTLDRMESDIRFNELREEQFEVEDAHVTVQYLNHTSLCMGYRVEADGKTVCYCTDVEPNSRFFLRSELRDHAYQTSDLGEALHAIVHEEDRRYARFVRGADLLIHDAMYTEDEYPSKVGWGHSTAEFATDLAMLTKVRQLALYHHEPIHDDAKIDEMLAACRERAAHRQSSLDVVGAAEGLEISV